MYCVYALRWPKSSLVYVGRTGNIAARLAAHTKKFKSLGLGRPYMDILENNLTEEQAFKAEQRWILLLDSTIADVGLNKTYGGELGKERLVESKKPHKVRAAPASKRKKRVRT